MSVVVYGRGSTSRTIFVTIPRPLSETRANCKGDQPFTDGEFASMVCSFPSPFMMVNDEMVNDEAVSAKIGPSTVPPCTSMAVIPPMLKNPPADSLHHAVVLGKEGVEGILSNTRVHGHLIGARAHGHSLVANVDIARHVHDVSGRCLRRIVAVVVSQAVVGNDAVQTRGW